MTDEDTDWEPYEGVPPEDDDGDDALTLIDADTIEGPEESDE